MNPNDIVIKINGREADPIPRDASREQIEAAFKQAEERADG